MPVRESIVLVEKESAQNIDPIDTIFDNAIVNSCHLLRCVIHTDFVSVETRKIRFNPWSPFTGWCGPKCSRYQGFTHLWFTSFRSHSFGVARPDNECNLLMVAHVVSSTSICHHCANVLQEAPWAMAVCIMWGQEYFNTSRLRFLCTDIFKSLHDWLGHPLHSRVSAAIRCQDSSVYSSATSSPARRTLSRVFWKGRSFHTERFWLRQLGGRNWGNNAFSYNLQ